MLRSKTLITKLFPKLGELPSNVQEELIREADDGSFLFAPPERHETESSYTWWTSS